MFESFVNSEEYQTGEYAGRYDFGLRALLIQKSIKHRRKDKSMSRQFESFVNSEEYQTILL